MLTLSYNKIIFFLRMFLNQVQKFFYIPKSLLILRGTVTWFLVKKACTAVEESRNCKKAATTDCNRLLFYQS